VSGGLVRQLAADAGWRPWPGRPAPGSQRRWAVSAAPRAARYRHDALL